MQEARDAFIPVAELGKTGGDAHHGQRQGPRGVGANLRAAHEGWFPSFMGREEIPLTN